MTRRMRLLVVLAIAMALLVPVTAAQKPPAPAPAPPSSAPPGRPAPPPSPNSEPSQTREDLVMFLRGRVATQDGAPVPSDLLVERVCNNRTHQEVYASSHGDFSMQLGSRADSFPEASADRTSPYGVASRESVMGIPRRELKNCELRASGPGFHPSVLSLIDLDPSDSNIDVGVIVVRRGTKIEGTTVSAIPYKAPKNARKAYEKGVQAEKNGKLADAHKYFETAGDVPQFRERLVSAGYRFAERKPDGRGSQSIYPSHDYRYQVPAALSFARVNGLPGRKLDGGPYPY